MAERAKSENRAVKVERRSYWHGTLQAGAEYALSPASDMTVDSGATLDMNGFEIGEIGGKSGDTILIGNRGTQY